MFANTSLITVRPEHTIVNGTDGTIWIGQQRDAPVAARRRRGSINSQPLPQNLAACVVGNTVALPSRSQIGWEWPDRRHGASSGARRAVRIKLADFPKGHANGHSHGHADDSKHTHSGHWLWSDPFVFDVGTTTLKMHHRGASKSAVEDSLMQYVSIETVPHPQGGTRTIVRHLNPHLMEYRIVNRCAAYTVRFRQHGAPREHEHRVPPLTECPFAWDHPEREHDVWMHVGRTDVVGASESEPGANTKMQVCESSAIKIHLDDSKAEGACS